MKNHEVRIASIDPERDPFVPRCHAELDPRDTVRIAVEAGEAVVQDGAADRPRPTEVKRSSFHTDNFSWQAIANRCATPLPRAPGALGVSTRSSRVRYGCAPPPNGQASRPAFGAVVRTARPSSDSVYSTVSTSRERVAGVGDGGDAPGRCARGRRSRTVQASQRTSPWIALSALGFVERDLVALTAEVVRAVLEPVRPRCEDLPAARGAHLVAVVAVEHRVAPDRERPQPTPHFDDHGPLVAERNLDLLTGRRAHTLASIRSSRCSPTRIAFAMAVSPGSPRRCSGRSWCRRRRGCRPHGLCSSGRARRSRGLAEPQVPDWWAHRRSRSDVHVEVLVQHVMVARPVWSGSS